jgi:hypothetical protein
MFVGRVKDLRERSSRWKRKSKYEDVDGEEGKVGKGTKK